MMDKKTTGQAWVARLRGTGGTAALATTMAMWGLIAPAISAAASLTLYNAQHEQVVAALAKDFQKESGISVKIRNGEGPAMAAQILAEGAASPADIYFTENSPELMLLDKKGLLAKTDAATLATVPSRFSAPDGNWVGVLARENVLVYNTKKVDAAQLPASLMDLANPEWRGKVGIAPSDGDFLPVVSAVIAMKGEAAALEWLKGLKANAQVFDDDEGVVAAVNRGGVATGVINNYYWARLHTQLGDSATHSALYHFGNGDVGALVNVSGAAVLKSSQNQAEAQRFLTYLVSERAQKLMANGKVVYEYPLRPGVAPDPILKPFDQLSPPDLSVSQLGDDSQAARLLRQAGLL